MFKRRDDTHKAYKKQVENNLVVYSHLKGFCAPLYLMKPITDITKDMEAQRIAYISGLILLQTLNLKPKA